MPSRWEVTLAGPAGAAIPLAAPLAVVSGWLDDRASRGRPAARQRSGHGDQSRKWACGPLRTLPDGVFSLQVRLLDDRLAGRLREAVQPGRSVRFGESAFHVSAEPREISRAAWADLRQWDGERAWQVRFITPVCVRRGNRTSPWPSPESLTRGLAERWRLLDPGTAPPAPGPGPGPVWVSDLDGRSEVQMITRRAHPNGQWQLAEEVVSGFTGRIRYVCDQGSEADAAVFGALMKFAVYAGAGAHTTYGFGALVPERTWQPPSLRAGQQ